MFNKILIFIALLVLIYLIYRQIKITEKFENDSISFIGMQKGNPKTLFYNQSNLNDTKYTEIKLPYNKSIKQYVYEKGTMVVLTPNNKIYYCTDCNFISGNIKWNVLTQSAFTNISRIALNDNRLFLLGSAGIIKTRNDFTNPVSLWNTIEMPSDDNSFKYMDAQYNHLVAIGSLTNFIYHKDITPTGLSQGWTILDKSKIMDSIKVTLHGYLGKTSPNELYQCKFPCDGSNGNMWNLINSDLTSSINANSEVISLVKDNTLFSCDSTCSSGSINQLSYPSFENGTVLDFVYPRLEALPTLVPFDKPKSKLDQTISKINNKITDYQNVTNNINSINKKFQQFMDKQVVFDNHYQQLNDQRNDLVNQVMTKIGVSNTEPFEDLLLENIMGGVKEKINIREDQQTNQVIKSSSLIIAL